MPSPRLNAVVFASSAGAIAAFTLWCVLTGPVAAAAIDTVRGWTSHGFGWFYVLAVVCYLVIVVGLALSPFGAVRLGPPDARPEYSLASWAAMLFAAGIGIDLLFFCVAEPLSHFLAPPRGEPGTAAAARHAMELTFLHWGLSGWGVYTLVGMSLAYFCYRRGLPLAIRSPLRPLLGTRADGVLGDVVDVAAMLATVFGIAASLGIGILQLGAGLDHMFAVPSSRMTQAALALLVVAAAAVSAGLGVDRGIRRLSELNMLLAAALLLFVLVAGETLVLLGALLANVGDYVTGFAALSFNDYLSPPPRDWMDSWTLFFWAWWIAWGPFVGLFLARISRGRTIRGFVAGTLLLPLVFMMAWMSVMGNSAIAMVVGGADVLGDVALHSPGAAIYQFLLGLPAPESTAVAVTVLALVFFVTSGDSASLVLSSLTAPVPGGRGDGPVWLRVLWAAIIGALTVALLLAGGLATLQSAVVVMGLPFALVLFLMAWGLVRALREEAAATRKV